MKKSRIKSRPIPVRQLIVSLILLIGIASATYPANYRTYLAKADDRTPKQSIFDFTTPKPTVTPTPSPTPTPLPDNTGGGGSNGDTDYSGPSSPPSGFRYVYQCDPRLAPDCICNSGCAIMSGHMALDYIRQFYVNDSRFNNAIAKANINFDKPMSTFNYYKSRGWAACGVATGWGWKDWMVNDLGLSTVSVNLVEGGVFNLVRAKYYIANKCIIIASSAPHVFIVDQILDVAKGIISIRDPGFGGTGNSVELKEKNIGPVIRNEFLQVTYYAHPVCPPGVK